MAVTDAPVSLVGQPYASLCFYKAERAAGASNHVSDLLIFTETGERPGRDGEAEMRPTASFGFSELTFSPTAELSPSPA